MQVEGDGGRARLRRDVPVPEPRPGWANWVAAGKRPLHNMCPIVAVKKRPRRSGRGGAGGRTIVNNVAAVAIHRLLLGLDPAVAMAAPRVQCESGEPAVLERAAGETVFETLAQRGHRVTPANRDAGTVELAVRVEGTDGWVGAAEPRIATSGSVSA